MPQSKHPVPLNPAQSPLDGPPSSIKETNFTSPFQSPVHSRSNSIVADPEAEATKVIEDQQAFAEKRETLVLALDSTTSLVKGLQAFNQDKWTIHYPHHLGVVPPPYSQSVSYSAPSSPRSSSRASSLRRTASADDSSDGDDTDSSESTRSRRSTNATTCKTSSPAPSIHHPLSILSLDLKLGHPTSPTASLPALLPSLSLATLSQLLSRRLTTSLSHLASLRTRVVDTSSRILVTGDLNAGKSTLVNAILRRQVMPSDQQPCTTAFCEVLDAGSYNEGNEEIHAIKDLDQYDRLDPSTFQVYSLDQVQEVQDSNETYQLLKAFVTDARGPTGEDESNPSFIKNGIVSISLIDAPGLNRDTLSTTALFARQSEIDVIVFVVSAENHFTLSAKEFLWNASREKAYVFIVVNKWAAIKDKTRCMRLVGEQIAQLSPATWEARHELVHFVDAAEVIADGEVDPNSPTTASFDHLEHSLRSFVLLKRAKSKLAPAKHYLRNLLSDLSTLADGNIVAADEELAGALSKLEIVKPVHERLSAQRDEVEEGVNKIEETVVEKVKNSAWTRLERALEFVSEGKVVPDATLPEGVENLDLPEYPGIFALWSWASDVKRVLVQSLESEVRLAEDEARLETVTGVKAVMVDLSEQYLPGLEREQNERVFKPEVMFAKRRRGIGRLAARGVSTGLGLGTAGLGTNWHANDFEVSFLDLFDLEKIFFQQSSKITQAKKDEDDALETGAILSLGLGSMGMIGSRLIGVKGTFDTITRVLDILGSKAARKWAAPVIGVLTVGLVAYIIIDLPRAVPRNIGRKLEQSLFSPVSDSSPSMSPPTTFSSAHSDRIARETRKVLRLAGWDLRERFRTALEKSASERKEVEETVGKTREALLWLGGFVDKVEEEEKRVEAVAL